MDISNILKHTLGKVGDEAAYDILKRMIFGGDKPDDKTSKETTEGEKSPKVRFGGLLESGDETGYEAAKSELEVGRQANIDSYAARKLDHHQRQRLRVLTTLLRGLRDVYVEKELVEAGTDKQGKSIFRDKERRKVFDPAVNFLNSFAQLTDAQKDAACVMNGVLNGDDEWIREQQAKAKELKRNLEAKAIEAAEGLEPIMKQLFFRVLTLGFWGGPRKR